MCRHGGVDRNMWGFPTSARVGPGGRRSREYSTSGMSVQRTGAEEFEPIEGIPDPAISREPQPSEPFSQSGWYWLWLFAVSSCSYLFVPSS